MDVAIIAHGQPGEPAPLQAAVEALATKVAKLLPGWRIRGATLADAASMAALGRVQLVYPLFMSEGWFTRTELPRRLRAVGAEKARVLRPLGLDPALPAIGAQLARAAATGLDPPHTRLVVVGHGSGGPSRASAEATRAFADAVAPLAGFASTRIALIEEAPLLTELYPVAPSVCLPFFATAAGHVTQDIPAAWVDAGPIAPAVGTAPQVPALIAAALVEARGAD
ncbi:cobalamin biosynthesis protein CbiX [Paracoccus suum]|uniref:Cobalamin biosynthesis protein CbiX n=1 Tax=Paracoccus suum TaxID=2259340 RepID=A0A344PJY1_9RHOB|nr:cobalamin biosynthesis protein CbiX [Paracoccus suum]AXC49686.1 cobalamin biosynthesis protein CbiX [Paracoccus suum]